MNRCWTRTVRGVALATSACAAMALPATSRAQVTAPGPITPTGTVAPLQGAGGRLFTLDVNGRVTYDSNIAGGQNLLADVKGLHKDDILYQPSVSISLDLPMARQALFINGYVGYDFHQYNENLNGGRVNLTGGGLARVGPCSGTGTLGYAISQSDQAFLPLDVVKNLQTVASAGLQVRCTSGRIGEFVGVQDISASNSAHGLVDSNTASVNGGFYYQNRALGDLSVYGAYSSTDYDSNNDPALPPTPGFRTYSVGVSLARPIGARLKGSAGISYETAKSRDGTGSSFSGLGAQGSLEYRVSPRLQATLLFSRDIQPTIQQGSNFTIVQLVEVDGSYRISSRISAGLGASWNNVDYRGSLLLPTSVTSDRIQAIYGNASIRLGRRASIAFDVRRDTRNTNLTLFDYTDYRVGVTATQSF
jgi:hypothetical protein